MLLFHNSLSTTDTFLQNLWFSTKNTAPVRSPWGNEHSALHILLKMATGRIIKQMIEKILNWFYYMIAVSLRQITAAKAFMSVTFA